MPFTDYCMGCKVVAMEWLCRRHGYCVGKEYIKFKEALEREQEKRHPEASTTDERPKGNIIPFARHPPDGTSSSGDDGEEQG